MNTVEMSLLIHDSN